MNLASLINFAHNANNAGEFSKALSACQAALNINSSIPEAWFNLGIAYRGLLLPHKAIEAQRKALLLSKKSSSAQNDISLELLELGDIQYAIRGFKKSIAINPRNSAAHANLGKAYLQDSKIEYALHAIKQAYRINPESDAIGAALGSVLREAGKINEAEELLRAIAEKRNCDEMIFFNLGNLLQSKGEHEDAIKQYKKSLNIDPAHVKTLVNMASSLKQLGYRKEATNLLEQALKIDPQHPEANHNLALTKLSQGDFGLAVSEAYEYRFRLNAPISIQPAPTLRRWSGESLDARRILVRAEQGIGDEVLYSRFLESLSKEHGHSAKISASADKRLHEIFVASFPGINFIDRNSKIDCNSYDLEIPLASLPMIFLKDVNDLKMHPPHLILPSHTENPAPKKNQTKTNEPKVCGISWKSSNKEIGKAKSLALETFVPILCRKNIEFVNLQYGETLKEIEKLKKETGLAIVDKKNIDKKNDIRKLLILIDSCDFVITTSNATAHFAGALNKETYLLVPENNGKLWYWHHRSTNNHSLWYPSVKIFDQSPGGSWSEAIEKISDLI